MSRRFASRILFANFLGFSFLIAGCGSTSFVSSVPSSGVTSAGLSSSAHGLWAYNGNSIAAADSGAGTLRDFAVSQQIGAVYISALPTSSNPQLNSQISNLISVLHQSQINVEALIGSTTGDEPGAPRNALLAIVQNVVQFNQQFPATQFDGIHLDIEPQQRPENSGANALQFLPNLIETYREANAEAAPANMVVDADIPIEVLRASADQRQALFTAVPRLTLMLYGVTSQSSGLTVQQQVTAIQQASQNYISMAYDGLSGNNLATLAMGLNTTDYGYDLMPTMLSAVDQSNGTNAHYSGWSRYSYSDFLNEQSLTEGN
jgi:hypothetical protein